MASTVVVTETPLTGASLSDGSEHRVQIRGTEYVNRSAQPLGVLLDWFPKDAQAEKVVFLPDVCPGKSPLPTGSVMHTRDPNWRRFAVSDCGCGMQLLKSELFYDEFDNAKWDALGASIRGNKGRLGDLGGGNHFLDAIASHQDGRLYFLIHTGSRLESGLVDNLVDSPRKFDEEFQRVVGWARDNRDAVADEVMKKFGSCQQVFEKAHNTYEILPDDSVIIRKGAVHSHPGEQLVLPSSLTGEVALLEATGSVDQTLFSLSHGTGRTIPRGQAREVGTPEDFETIRKKLYIPEYIKNESLRTELPFCYRPLDDCLTLLGDLVQVRERFDVVAYLGHL